MLELQKGYNPCFDVFYSFSFCKYNFSLFLLICEILAYTNILAEIIDV